jgi:hypothetical protein
VLAAQVARQLRIVRQMLAQRDAEVGLEGQVDFEIGSAKAADRLAKATIERGP